MGVVIVSRVIDRNQIDRAVANTGFGADLFGEAAHRLRGAAQKQRLQTIVVIQMYMLLTQR